MMKALGRTPMTVIPQDLTSTKHLPAKMGRRKMKPPSCVTPTASLMQAQVSLPATLGARSLPMAVAPTISRSGLWALQKLARAVPHSSLL